MAYTRLTTWAAGQVLTHTALNAEFDAVAADVNAKTGVDLVNGTVQVTKLASAYAAFTITVPCIKDADALSTNVLATAEAGLERNYTAADFPVVVPRNCSLIKVTAACRNAVSAGGTNDNDAVVRKNGVDQAATRTAWPDGGGATTTSLGATVIALNETDTVVIRCRTDTAATDGVVGATVYLHCLALHQALP